jgi:hypothetical protein
VSGGGSAQLEQGELPAVGVEGFAEVVVGQVAEAGVHEAHAVDLVLAD